MLVYQTAALSTHQHLEHFFGVRVDLDELPVQSRNLEDMSINLLDGAGLIFVLTALKLDGG